LLFSVTITHAHITLGSILDPTEQGFPTPPSQDLTPEQNHRTPYLLTFELRPDVGELLVDARPLRLLVLAIPHIADERGQPSHSRDRHP
jgi:hypothetical protein